MGAQAAARTAVATTKAVQPIFLQAHKALLGFCIGIFLCRVVVSIQPNTGDKRVGCCAKILQEDLVY